VFFGAWIRQVGEPGFARNTSGGVWGSMAAMPSTDADKAGTLRPPADPTGIELRYSHVHHWDITYNDAPEVWHVSADVPDAEDKDGQPTVSHVGDIEIVFVDPYDPNAFDLLDGQDAGLGRVGEVVLDFGDGGRSKGWQRDLMERFEPIGGDLLILNRVDLTPGWRGFGIGVLLAGLAMKRLSRGCQGAAVYPDEAAADKLSTVWAQLGFEHFRDGVHVLDFAITTLDETIGKLHVRIASYY
jgi:GNAT superfamily N-acetyltransferase